MPQMRSASKAMRWQRLPPGKKMRRYLQWLIPILKIIGKLHVIWSVKRLHYTDAQAIIRAAMPGDVLLSVCRGQLTNWLIPGKWKHSALYAGDGKVIEATGHGVVENTIWDFVMSKDFVALVRPIAHTQDDRIESVNMARAMLGKPYDYLFDGKSPKSFYCSELVYYCLRISGWKFVPRKRLGEYTISPDDFYKAKNHFVVITER